NHIFSAGVNGTAVGNLSAIDVDSGDTHTFQLSGRDQGSFEIVDGNVLKLKDELTADTLSQSVYELIVKVTDSSHRSFNKKFSLNVIENEAPTSLILAGDSVVAENSDGVIIGNFTLSDPDASDSHSFVLSGSDAALFEISGQQLKLKEGVSADFEDQPSYSVTVTATDSGYLSITEDFVIAVADANDAAVISVVDQGMTEGDAAVSGTVSHTDSDANNGDNVFQVIASGTASTKGYGSYSLSSEGSWTYTLKNTDATINGLRVGQTETDSIKVIAEDGTFEYATITISGTNDAPVLSGDRTGNVVEDIGPGTAAGTLVGSDVDAGDSLTFSVDDTTGTYGSLAMGSETGAWTYTLNNNDSDTDALADGVSVSDSFTVALDDGQGGRVTGDVTIAIAGTNDGPVITSGGSISVPENSTAVTTITASDVDDSELEYTIVSSADQSSFTLDAVTGELVFNTAPDYESPASSSGDNNYDVTVSVSDGQLTDSQALNVTVSNVEGVPVFSSPVAKAVYENQTTVMTLTASDDEHDQVAFSISGGNDASAFSLTSDGVLSFQTAPDYETKSSYSLTVTATESATQSGGVISNPNSSEQDITVTIADANDAAVISVV
ncbi:MAG: VCBS domain-containing protein, partial [bacterium]|nr:VCBS domain-containing protein [bacterium]